MGRVCFFFFLLQEYWQINCQNPLPCAWKPRSAFLFSFFNFYFFVYCSGVPLFSFIYKDITQVLKSSGLLFSLWPVFFLLHCACLPLKTISYNLSIISETELWILVLFVKHLSTEYKECAENSLEILLFPGALTASLPVLPEFDHLFSFLSW